jgi:uncharacterized membrane protein
MIRRFEVVLNAIPGAARRVPAFAAVIAIYWLMVAKALPVSGS